MRDKVTLLQCNAVSHWLSPYTEWSLHMFEPSHTYIYIYYLTIWSVIPKISWHFCVITDHYNEVKKIRCLVLLMLESTRFVYQLLWHLTGSVAANFRGIWETLERKSHSCKIIPSTQTYGHQRHQNSKPFAIQTVISFGKHLPTLYFIPVIICLGLHLLATWWRHQMETFSP